MHKLSQELEKKCNINREPISSPLYKPSTQGPTWEMLGNLFNGDKIIYNLDPFVYKQEIFRNKALLIAPNCTVSSSNKALPPIGNSW